MRKEVTSSLMNQNSHTTQPRPQPLTRLSSDNGRLKAKHDWARRETSCLISSLRTTGNEAVYYCQIHCIQSEFREGFLDLKVQSWYCKNSWSNNLDVAKHVCTSSCKTLRLRGWLLFWWQTELFAVSFRKCSHKIKKELWRWYGEETSGPQHQTCIALVN